MMEWCSNDTYEMDDTTLLAKLIEQLEWKKTIFTGLDKQIFAGIIVMIWKLKYLSQRKYNLNFPQQWHG